MFPFESFLSIISLSVYAGQWQLRYLLLISLLLQINGNPTSSRPTNNYFNHQSSNPPSQESKSRLCPAAHPGSRCNPQPRMRASVHEHPLHGSEKFMSRLVQIEDSQRRVGQPRFRRLWHPLRLRQRLHRHQYHQRVFRGAAHHRGQSSF